jgi:bla regulator protein BlaR1
VNQLTLLGSGVFRWVLQTTWQASVLAGLILLAQLLLRKRLAPSQRYGLWLLLVIRLLMPVTPQSGFSIFNLAPKEPAHPVSAFLPPPSTGADPYFVVNSFNGTFPLTNPAVAALAAALTERPDDSMLVPSPGVTVRPPRQIDWFRIAFWSWLTGVFFFGARLIWTNARFHSRIGGYRFCADENVMRLFNGCRAAFNITQPVSLIESEEVESPAVYGLWRKWLLLPDGVFERFSFAELRHIFLHELAHIKRGDLGVNWLVAMLQVLHWFNPVLWLAWARMRADRELATDALALAHLREMDHAPYGETILKVLEGLTRPPALPGLVGIVENKAQLKERLAAIARPGKTWKWASVFACILIVNLGLTRAQIEKIPAAAPAARPDLIGRVESTNGQPLQATVFISTAGPKVGTSVFCPSCYDDCRKKAVTDNQGNFKIESLDPQLIFRILVVGNGFQPRFVHKVDPARGPVTVDLEPQNLAGLPPGQIFRGRVIDTKGAPIEGAAVEALG